MQPAPFEIPMLDALRSQLRVRGLARASDGDRRGRTGEWERVLNLELEQLPYNLHGAFDAVSRVEEHLAALIEVALEGLPFVHESVIGLVAEQTLPISWAVDHFLDASRRAQNALTRYVARAFDVSLRQSLPDVLADTAKLEGKVPKRVIDLLSEYWSVDGKTLKHYRDLAQHHAVVASDAFVCTRFDGASEVRFLLPSVPDNKSLKALSYGPPYVHVGSYCRTALSSLVTVSSKLTYLLVRDVGLPAQVSRALLRHPASLSPDDSFAPPPSGDLEQFVAMARDNAWRAAHNEWG